MDKLTCGECGYSKYDKHEEEVKAFWAHHANPEACKEHIANKIRLGLLKGESK